MLQVLFILGVQIFYNLIQTQVKFVPKVPIDIKSAWFQVYNDLAPNLCLAMTLTNDKMKLLIISTISKLILLNESIRILTWLEYLLIYSNFQICYLSISHQVSSGNGFGVDLTKPYLFLSSTDPHDPWHHLPLVYNSTHGGMDEESYCILHYAEAILDVISFERIFGIFFKFQFLYESNSYVASYM